MAKLNDAIIAAVKRQVWTEFPEMEGIEPDVTPSSAEADPGLLRKLGAARPKGRSRALYLLTFRQSVTAGDGATIPRVVRATVDSDGTLVKMTVSK
jgi:hypothetical protein